MMAAYAAIDVDAVPCGSALEIATGHKRLPAARYSNLNML